MPGSLITRSLDYARLGLAARRLRKATDDAVRDHARRHLAERMGRLRGLPQKIGQILSMSDDAAKADVFADLRDAAEPLPFDEIAPILAESWGRPIADAMRDIDPRGLAASLGQVHRATLHDGRAVAVKVQYPDIRLALKNDLKLLGWITAPVGDLRCGFDLAAYRAEVLRDVDAELDYFGEAARQIRFGRLLSETPGWMVPEVIADLSNDRVLTSQWINGATIDAAATWPKSDREQLATGLIRGFFHLLFGEGVLHADPHPGNYRFVNTSTGPAVALLDFGSVVEIPLEHRVALLKLFDIAMQRRGDPYHPLLALGFNARLLGPIRSKLAALCSVLFEPFTLPGKYDLDTWRRSARIDDILGDDRWNFRLAGPANLLLVMRAFRGLTYYLDRLGEDVSWSQAIAPHLSKHRASLQAIRSEAAPDQSGSFERMAKHLKIRVEENGVQKVALTFQGSAVDDLDELMDDGLKARIQAQGIDLAAMSRRVRASAYMPQELFALSGAPGQRAVRVWLE